MATLVGNTPCHLFISVTQQFSGIENGDQNACSKAAVYLKYSSLAQVLEQKKNHVLKIKFFSKKKKIKIFSCLVFF